MICRSCLLVLLVFFSTCQGYDDCTSDNCKLPSCHCVNTAPPAGLDPDQTPQMVAFTFDDAVNKQTFEDIQKIFTVERKNPNGCRIVGTMFVSHNWTDYCKVNELWAEGHEIASHSITHKLPIEWWRNASREEWEMEIEGQKQYIADLAEIPEDEIKGMRSPFLQIGGDRQFRMLYSKGYEYDSTLVGIYDTVVWPYTMDYPPPHAQCLISPCPVGRYPGLWQMPIQSVKDTQDDPCTFIDKCATQPRNEVEAYSIFRTAFLRRYTGDRAPFIINLHAEWFEKEKNLKGTLRFVDEILESYNDVYFVTIHQIIEWMRNPLTTRDVTKYRFRPWMCTSTRRRMNCNPE